MDQALKIILSLTGLLFSLMFHEQMHARVALWLGDPTGKNENRLSWNPVHHLDPFMSVILPILLWVSTRGQFVFGGAKPCPINPMNFRNPSLGFCLSAAAGPASNFFLAAVAFGLCVAIYHAYPNALLDGRDFTPNGYFFVSFIVTNLVLAAFNLLPVPPLDGSRIARHFAPREIQSVMDSVEPYGLILIMVLMYFGGSKILGPVIGLGLQLLEAATGSAFGDALWPRRPPSTMDVP